MTLHSEIWQRSVLGLSAEEIAADLEGDIDRAIKVEDKPQFVRACLANIERNPDLGLSYGDRLRKNPYTGWVPATEERHREMEKRYLGGEKPDQIGESYGVSAQTIIWHLKHRGVLKRTVAPKQNIVAEPKVAPRNLTFCPVQEVAPAQRAWERRQALLRARRAGEPVRRLAEAIGKSQPRVRQLLTLAERQEGKMSPIERWMADRSYLLDLAGEIRASVLADRNRS